MGGVGSRRRRLPPERLPRPGLARAGRWIRPVRTAEGAWLTREAEERFFACAEVLLEGEVLPGGAEGEPPRWTGCAMFTVGLAEWLGAVPLAHRLRYDGARLAELLDGSVRVHLRAMRRACAEVARRVPKHSLGRADVQVRVRYETGSLLLDVDLEVPLLARELSSAHGP